MTAFRRSNSTDLRSIADDIVGHLDRVAAARSRRGAGHDVDGQLRVPAGNGEESGRWTKEDGDPEPVELASLSAPGDMEEIAIHGRPPLTDDQIAAIIFNETNALHGPNLHKARVDMASTIINADDMWGGKRKSFARTAPDKITRPLSPEEQQALAEVRVAVQEARDARASGSDPANGATNFDLPYSVDKDDPDWKLKKGLTERRGYRTFWDSGRDTKRSIRILQNDVATRHRQR